MHPSPPPVTGVLLAGGQGQRMGGRDKGLLPLAGHPLAAWALSGLSPQVSRVIISANRHAEIYGTFGHPVVADTVADHAGPLAGLCAALARVDTPWVVTCPCDSPRPPPDLVWRLEAARRRAGAPVAVAHDGIRLQPLFALLASALHLDLQDHIQQGGRRAGEWLLDQGAVVADFSDRPRAFDNLNTETDRCRLEAELAGAFPGNGAPAIPLATATSRDPSSPPHPRA
ncbi:MAG: molybdenum cofactor guanylyltransferase MobA [Ectothiorhodospira sp.]